MAMAWHGCLLSERHGFDRLSRRMFVLLPSWRRLVSTAFSCKVTKGSMPQNGCCHAFLPLQEPPPSGQLVFEGDGKPKRKSRGKENNPSRSQRGVWPKMGFVSPSRSQMGAGVCPKMGFVSPLLSFWLCFETNPKARLASALCPPRLAASLVFPFLLFFVHWVLARCYIPLSWWCLNR